LNGLALVSLAGPASNVVMAVILAVVSGATATAAPGVSRFLAYGVQLSLYLGLFNLLPVPPLDGSKLLLAARIPMQVYAELARFGFVLLIVLITSTGLGRWLAVWSYDGAQLIFRGLGIGG
jgi:Zn-dependent protease